MDDKENPTSFGGDLQNSDSVSALKHEEEDRPLSSETISISERPIIGESISKVVQSGHGRRLEIRVVDETALIGSVFSFLKAKNDDEKNKKNARKMVYSRETMESLRFLNMKKQREMWNDVHVGLGPTVRKEYDFLLTCTASWNHHQPKINFLFNNIPSASLSHSGSFAPRERVSQVNVSAN